jgi:hypothetical protein
VTEVANKEKIRQVYLSILKTSQSFLDSNLSFQDLFSQKVKKEEKAVFDLLLSYLTKGEVISPGSSDLILEFLVKGKSGRETKPSSFQKKDLDLLLRTYCKDNVTLEMTKKSFEIAGFGGKISILYCEKDSVELTKGFFFEAVKPSFDTKNRVFLNPRIVCIDGLVESVSEIHHLLETCAEKKEPLIIFLRGISEEVTHTLKVNFERNTLDVVPVVVAYDLDGVNLLKDIAAVCKEDIVSSLKGDLISAINFSLLKRVEKVSFSKGSTVIENSSLNLDSYLKFLQEKIISSSNETERKILEKRLSRLGNNQVVIRLADNKEKKARSFYVDRSIRAVKSAIDFGVTIYNGKMYPCSTLETADMLSKKFLETLDEVGALVY